MGVAGWAAKYRPVLVGVAIVFLALAFYFTYRRSPSRRNKITLWATVGAVSAVLSVSYLMGAGSSTMEPTDPANPPGEASSADQGMPSVLDARGACCLVEAGVEDRLKELSSGAVLEVLVDESMHEGLVDMARRWNCIQLESMRKGSAVCAKLRKGTSPEGTLATPHR